MTNIPRPTMGLSQEVESIIASLKGSDSTKFDLGVVGLENTGEMSEFLSKLFPDLTAESLMYALNAATGSRIRIGSTVEAEK